MSMDWGAPAMARAMMAGPLQFAGLLVDSWETGAKLYLSLWGPLGQPLVDVVEMVAQAHRQVLDGLAGLADGPQASR